MNRTQKGQKQDQQAAEKGQIGIYSHHPFTPDVLIPPPPSLSTLPRRNKRLVHPEEKTHLPTMNASLNTIPHQ
jgi:hypothetical protein